jgi:hypothetical protein
MHGGGLNFRGVDHDHPVLPPSGQPQFVALSKDLSAKIGAVDKAVIALSFRDAAGNLLASRHERTPQ